MECRLEVGGWYSIASLCSYFACTVLICCLPKRTEPILNLLLKKDEDIQRSSSVAQKGGEDNGYENNADMEAQTTPLVPVVLSSKATPEKQSSKHVVAAPEENSEIESLLEKKSSTSSRPQDDPTETKPESVSLERPETTAFTAATTSDSDKLPQNKQPSTKKMKQTMKSDSRKHDSDEDTDDTETANRKYLEQIIRSDRGSIDENNDDGSVDDGDRGGIEENNDDDNRRGGLDSVDDELEQLQARLKARHKELGVILDDMSDINSISNLLENDEPSESDNAKPVLVMNKPEPNQTAKKATPKNPEVIQINQNSDTPLNELLDDDDTSSASSDIFVPVQTKATAQASRAGKQQLTKDTDLGPARHNHVSRLADLLDDDESNCSDIFVPVQKNGPTQQSSLAKQPLSNHAKLGSTNQKSESRLADLLDDDSSSASSGNFVPAQKQESPQISLESKQRPPKDTKLGKTETNARDGGDNALASSERIVPAQKQPPPQKALAAKQRPSKDTKLGKDSGDDVEHSEQVAYKSNSDSSTKSNGDSRGHIHSTSSWKSTSSFVNPHTGDGDFPDIELKNKPTRDVQSFLVPITPMLLGPMTDVDSSDDDSDDLFVRLEQIQSEQLQKKQQKQASKPAPTKKQTYVAPTRNLDDKTTTKSNNTMTRRPQQQQKQLPKSKEETTSIMAQQQKEVKLKPTEPMSLMARLQQQQQQQQQLSSKPSKSRAPPVNKKKPPHKNSSSRSDSFYSKASASKPAKQKNASSPTNVMARLQQQQQQQQWQQEEADSWVPKHYSPRRPNMSKFGTRVSPSSEGSSNAS